MAAQITNLLRRWTDFFQFKPQAEDAETARPVQPETPPTDQPSTAETKTTALVDPRVQLRNDSRALGYKTARKSGALAPVPATLAALKGDATAMALALHKTYSDADDERKRRRYETLEHRLERQIEKRDRAKVRAQEARREWAEMGPGNPRPTVSALLRHAATLGLTLSIAPTAHDLAVGLDPFMRWLVGGVAAWGLSLFIIHSLMPSSSDSSPGSDDGTDESDPKE